MPTKPAKVYDRHAAEPFLKNHPRGAQKFWPANPPEVVDFAMVARACEMSVAELGLLNFGTTNSDEIDWYCINYLGAKSGVRHPQISPVLDRSHRHVFANISLALDHNHQLWVPLMNPARTAHLAFDPKIARPFDYDDLHYDHLEAGHDALRQLAAAQQAPGSVEVVNTIGRDFRLGDILLSEHMGDKFIQQMTLSWPTHAGIVTDDQADQVTDAMPGRGVGPGGERTNTNAIDSEAIRKGKDSFFGKATTPGGGLVVRYTGGTAPQGGRVEKLGLDYSGLSELRRLPGGYQGTTKSELLKSMESLALRGARARSSSRREAKPKVKARKEAIRAAAWAKDQVGKNYQFTLQSNIIGLEVEGRKSRPHFKKGKGGQFVVPDKIFVLDRCEQCGFGKPSVGCTLACKCNLRSKLKRQDGELLCGNCGDKVHAATNHECDWVNWVTCPTCGFFKNYWACNELHSLGLTKGFFNTFIADDQQLCLACGEIRDGPKCCERGAKKKAAQDYHDGAGPHPATYFSYSGREWYQSSVLKETSDHSIYCAEFVWRAYRFGAGVTLVKPKDFFHFWKHPDRATYSLLSKEMGGGLQLEAHTYRGRTFSVELQRKFIEHVKLFPNKAVRFMTLEILIKPRHPGRILAPVQLAQSPKVKIVHRIPEMDGHKPHHLYDIDDTNLDPLEVLQMLSDKCKVTDPPMEEKMRRKKAQDDAEEEWNELNDQRKVLEEELEALEAELNALEAKSKALRHKWIHYFAHDEKSERSKTRKENRYKKKKEEVDEKKREVEDKNLEVKEKQREKGEAARKAEVAEAAYEDFDVTKVDEKFLDKWMEKYGGKQKTYTVQKPWDEATNRKQPAST